MKHRKVKQVLFGYWYQWDGGGYKEEDKYSGNIMYSYMKIEK
jgi:chitinase